MDALRAFAALAVVNHHLGPIGGIVGDLGWMGVDLFFVLSGYFITTILLDERGTPGYYRRFYLRRALRILPLYYLVVGVILLSARLSAHGAAYQELVSRWGSPLWFWLYAANIHMAAREMGPTIFALTPLWSVQVEEQFYIIYPLVIALVPPRHLRGVLLSAIAAALFFRVVLMVFAPGPWKVYALMPCRMDALAMGSLIAEYVSNSKWPLQSGTTIRLGLAGVVLISVLVYFAGPDSGTIAMSTIGHTLIGLTSMMIVAWLILKAGQRSTRWLRLRPICAVGEVSYGLYVLHIPTCYAAKLVIARLGYGDGPASLRSILCIAASVAVAAASYRWMEQPILRSRTRLERWLSLTR